MVKIITKSEWGDHLAAAVDEAVLKEVLELGVGGEGAGTGLGEDGVRGKCGLLCAARN